MAYLITIIIWVAIDQASKAYIVKNFVLYKPHYIISNIFAIKYTTNTGGAFGILSLYPTFFVILTGALVVAGLLLIKIISKTSFNYQIALGSIIGGALGNLIDRIRIGKVIDFIDFSFWPTFNIADIGICVGVGLLAIQLYKEKSIEETTPIKKDTKDKEE